MLASWLCPRRESGEWLFACFARIGLVVAWGVLIMSLPSKAVLYPSVWAFPINNPATLGVFPAFVILWLTKEIQRLVVSPPLPLLEWGER